MTALHGSILLPNPFLTFNNVEGLVRIADWALGSEYWRFGSFADCRLSTHSGHRLASTFDPFLPLGLSD